MKKKEIKNNFVEEEIDVIAELKGQISSPISLLSNAPNIDINQIFFKYFSTFDTLIRDFRNSILLPSITIESSNKIQYLQDQIDEIRSGLKKLERSKTSFSSQQHLPDQNLPLDLLSYYEKEFSKINSIKLVSLRFIGGSPELVVICEKTHKNFILEEREIYKIDYEAKKEFPLAKRVSLLLDGILSIKEIENLVNSTYIIINKSHEL